MDESTAAEKRIRADLHYHGPHALNPKVLKRFGYFGKNILKEIVDAALSRDLTVLALTSEDKEIPRNSFAHRLGFLVENFANSLPPEYKSGRLGKNVFVVDRNGRKLYLIEGQTPIVYDDNRRFDHLVVGSSEVPNLWPFKDTINWCSDHGLLQFLEHPTLEWHFGVGLEKAQALVTEYKGKITGIEGNNAMLCRRMNQQSRIFAIQNGLPYISNSDGHLIESAGLGYTEFPESDLKTDTEDHFIRSLTNVIVSNRIDNFVNYEPLGSWINWILKSRASSRNGEFDQPYQQPITEEDRKKAMDLLIGYKKAA